jgi:hypothetical protein
MQLPTNLIQQNIGAPAHGAMQVAKLYYGPLLGYIYKNMVVTNFLPHM